MVSSFQTIVINEISLNTVMSPKEERYSKEGYLFFFLHQDNRPQGIGISPGGWGVESHAGEGKVWGPHVSQRTLISCWADQELEVSDE